VSLFKLKMFYVFKTFVSVVSRHASYCAVHLGTGNAIPKRDRAVAVCKRDNSEPRKHCRAYIYLESIFLRNIH